MRIVLLKDQPNLGEAGKIIEVKDGYARNFLIPQGIAASQSDPKAQELLAHIAQRKKDQHLKDEETAKLINNLEGEEIVFKVKINKKGKPYFSIKPSDIAKKLKIDQGLIIAEPLKEIGEHQVILKTGDQQSKLKVKIEPEK